MFLSSAASAVYKSQGPFFTVALSYLFLRPPPLPPPYRPFFTVALSYLFLGTMPSVSVMLTLLPIVAGVVVASATDLSFNWCRGGKWGSIAEDDRGRRK